MVESKGWNWNIVKEDFYEDKGKLFFSYHYHVLVKKM